MDVRALLLLGAVGDANVPENLGGVPIALLDVLGRPVIHRVADRLCRGGVAPPIIIGEVEPQRAHYLRRAMRPDFRWLAASPEALWRATERTFNDIAQNGADVVLIIRLGAFAEIDFEQLLQFHLNQSGRVTAVVDGNGKPLGTFAISASRRNDAAFLLRHHLEESRAAFLYYTHTGYINWLAGAADLRKLAVDAFFGRVQITPEGQEIKPGIWAAHGARIHRAARVLAPAFIGERAKVRASAVVTRGSVLEHHAEVDCGTILEDTTILPYTRVGVGLDVAHALVGFSRIHHLRRQVEVDISDPKLVSTAPAPARRLLRHAASLAGLLPMTFLRGLLGLRNAELSLPGAAQSPSPALKAGDSLPARDPALSNFQ